MTNGQEIMGLLKEVNSLLEKGLKKHFANCPITIPQLNVINILSKVDKVKQSNLSQELMTTPAAVSGIMDRLEAQGVIERERSAEDKRVVYARLTDSFRENHKDLDNNIGGFMTLLIRTQEPAEIKKIVEGLETLKRVLQDSNCVISDHIGNKNDEESDLTC